MSTALTGVWGERPVVCAGGAEGEHADVGGGDVEGACGQIATCRWPIRVASWNSQALFGSCFGNHERIGRRRAVVSQLVQNHDVCCLQEVHGSR